MGSSQHGDPLRRGQLGRVVDLLYLPLRIGDPVDHRRRRGDEGEVVLALQPLLDDLHVEEPQVAAAKSEAERLAGLRLEGEGRVVEAQLDERVAQLVVVGGVDREDAAEDHGLHHLEAGERRLGGTSRLADGVAHLGVVDVLHVGDHHPHVAGHEPLHRPRERGEDAQVLDLELLPVREEEDALAGAKRPLEDPHQHDHPAVRVVPGVEDEGLERGLRIASRGRHLLHHLLEDLLDAHALLGAGRDRVRRVEADDLLDLPPDAFHVGAGEVDLVDDRDDLQVVVERLVDVGQRLRLHALGRVHHQDRPLAGGQRPGHLVREVDVTGGVDQVEDVLLPVPGPVGHADGLGLDGDAAFPLQLHVVEELGLGLPSGDRARELQQPVRERRLAVVDVRDDREIADVLVRVFHRVGAF